MPTEIPIPLDHEVFESAESCLEFLRTKTAPSSLFRGEARPWPKSCPGTLRILEDDSLHFQEKTYWIDLAGHFVDWFVDYTGQTNLNSAEMFLQHYGIPTDLLDFSSDPEIAIFFASLSHQDEPGMICCMDKERAIQIGEVFDLTNYSLFPGLQLERPKKQKGFAYRHRAGLPSDLKSASARELLGLTWYAFYKNGYEGLVESHRRILYVEDDKMALYILAYAAEFGLSTWQQADIGIIGLRRILSQLNLTSDYWQSDSGGRRAMEPRNEVVN